MHSRASRTTAVVLIARAATACLLLWTPTASAQATRPAVAAIPPSSAVPARPAAVGQAVTPASVAGRVSAAGGRALPEMIVYLESTDPAAVFPPPADVAHVSQREARFTPSLVVVSVGQSVDFNNDEARPVEHNVFSRSPAKPFDLGLYRPGSGAKLVRFDKPGPVRLFCSIHKFMDGAIYVCPTPFFAKVEPDGTYRIDNVPPGGWRLRTWQRSQRFNDRDVPLTLSPGQAAEQNLELARK